MILLIFPRLTTDVSEVLDWFEERGVARPTLWRGEDGSIRGSALVRSP